jgi:GT2 family glycosyltransferase
VYDSGLKFSIVIPTRNRPAQLESCLHAVFRINYSPSEYEVIVVADRSEAQVPDGVRLVRQTQLKGPGAARNLGAVDARGEVLAFTDDDCAPEPDWLAKLDEVLAKYPDALVGGRTRNALLGNRYAAATQSIVDFFSSGGSQFFASNNLCVSATAFHKIGGFDETWPLAAAEDRDLCARWMAGGRPLVYAREAVVNHAHDLTLGRFWRQHLRYGRGACWLRQKHPAMVHAGGVQIRLLRHAASEECFSLVAVAQLATVTGFVRQKLWP